MFLTTRSLLPDDELAGNLWFLLSARCEAVELLNDSPGKQSGNATQKLQVFVMRRFTESQMEKKQFRMMLIHKKYKRQNKTKHTNRSSTLHSQSQSRGKITFWPENADMYHRM